jgi:hypothetical protein
MPPAASLNSYIGDTNVVAKVIDSINQNPCIAQAKPEEINRTYICFPSVPGDNP